MVTSSTSVLTCVQQVEFIMENSQMISADTELKNMRRNATIPKSYLCPTGFA